MDGTKRQKNAVKEKKRTQKKGKKISKKMQEGIGFIRSLKKERGAQRRKKNAKRKEIPRWVGEAQRFKTKGDSQGWGTWVIVPEKEEN